MFKYCLFAIYHAQAATYLTPIAWHPWVLFSSGTWAPAGRRTRIYSPQGGHFCRWLSRSIHTHRVCLSFIRHELNHQKNLYFSFELNAFTAIVWTITRSFFIFIYLCPYCSFRPFSCPPFCYSLFRNLLFLFLLSIQFNHNKLHYCIGHIVLINLINKKLFRIMALLSIKIS